MYCCGTPFTSFKIHVRSANEDPMFHLFRIKLYPEKHELAYTRAYFPSNFPRKLSWTETFFRSVSLPDVEIQAPCIPKSRASRNTQSNISPSLLLYLLPHKKSLHVGFTTIHFRKKRMKNVSIRLPYKF